MDFTVREMHKAEYPLLRDFLYQAIYIPEGVAAPPKSVVELPELWLYIADFGSSPHDKAQVAEVDGVVIGAAWARIMDDYGHIDNQTPSLAISLYPDYRSQGIGTALMRGLLAALAAAGYQQTSLSVQKANYAVQMYRKLGFVVCQENEEEYVMVKSLR